MLHSIALHTPPMSPWVVAEEAASLRARLSARHDDDALLDTVLDRLADPGWDAVMHHRLSDQALWIELLRRFCAKTGEYPPKYRNGAFCNGADSGSRFMAFLDRDPQATLEDACAHARTMAACWSATLRTPEGLANIKKGVGGGAPNELRLLFSELAPRLPQVRTSRAADATWRGQWLQTSDMLAAHLLLQLAPGLLDGWVVARLYHTGCDSAKNAPTAWSYLDVAESTWVSVWRTLCGWDYPVTAMAKALPSEGFLLDAGRLYHNYNRFIGPAPARMQEAWLSVLRHPDATQAVLDAAHVAPEQAGSHAVVAAFAARAFSHLATGPAPHPRPRHRG